ncbi:MAG: hypothetical protein H6509_06495 [Bryobacterales bacterium]|nr:hypothetical protein [Acidobacteriota bacterium]MCB9384244.1 hypothetical protein [Bryobacterales bacterium]
MPAHFTDIAGRTEDRRILFLREHFGLLSAAARRVTVSKQVVSRAYRKGQGSEQVEQALLEECLERIGLNSDKKEAAA